MSSEKNGYPPTPVAIRPQPETAPNGASSPSRTLSAADLAGFLRIAVGLPPLEEGTAVDRTPITVDTEAWAEWCLAGLRLCTFPSETAAPQDRRGPWVPRIQDAAETGRRFAANLAISRHDSIAQAAANAGTSRRSLRETLKRAGTYQAPMYVTHDQERHDDGEAHDENGGRDAI